MNDIRSRAFRARVFVVPAAVILLAFAAAGCGGGFDSDNTHGSRLEDSIFGSDDTDTTASKK
ncbi:MAG: hypothetical protein GF418_00420 [Chitinivibrionales bacterium]|nr:hypothetical protein [Chitinivibrionales bacterium]MBD3394064.1 hypothetical protein [Chitinivibrionales bacterium]